MFHTRDIRLDAALERGEAVRSAQEARTAGHGARSVFGKRTKRVDERRAVAEGAALGDGRTRLNYTANSASSESHHRHHFYQQFMHQSNH